jgi:hypothetical protein
LADQDRNRRRLVKRAIEKSAQPLLLQYRIARRVEQTVAPDETPHVRVAFSLGNYLGLLNIANLLVEFIFKREEQDRIAAVKFLFQILRPQRSKKCNRIVEIFLDSPDLFRKRSEGKATVSTIS